MIREEHGKLAWEKLKTKGVRPMLTVQQMQSCKVQVVLQQPGQMVVLAPVSFLNWPTLCIFNTALPWWIDN